MCYNFDLNQRTNSFNSFSFRLSLNPILNELINHHDYKTNLFTLNYLEDPLTNREPKFFFGLNLIMSKLDNLIVYEFELYTSEQTILSELINLSNDNNLINITIEKDSIELKLNNKPNAVLRLNVIHNVFSQMYQLNLTTIEISKPIISNKKSNLLSSCLSDFRLSNDKSEIFKLIDLTKQISFYYSDLNDLEFDLTCDNKPKSIKSKIVSLNSASDRCFQVTKIDYLTFAKIGDFYDCKCDNIENFINKKCSFNFWTGLNGQSRELDFNEKEESRGCIDASDYACFNNGTCVDHSLLGYTSLNKYQNNRYSCMCEESYAGNR